MPKLSTTTSEQVSLAIESATADITNVPSLVDSGRGPETNAPWSWTGLDLPLEPAARKLPILFCPKLCDAIVKVNGYAKLKMSRGEQKGEVLSIEINREFVSLLAANLFGVAIKDMKEQSWRLDWEMAQRAM